MKNAETMAQVVGRNAQTLRRKKDRVTLEDLASAAQVYGLRWSTGSVGSFESGRTVGVNLETLLAVTAALGDVIGRTVTLAELFAGDGDVALTEGLTIPLATVREMLTGGGVSITEPAVMVHFPGIGDVPAVGTVRYSLPSLRETDLRICKSLGVDPQIGAKAMFKLWRSTFTAERDLIAGSDANAQRRGRISRGLKAQLQAELSKDGYRGNN